MSPELKLHFGFLEVYRTDDDKFYGLVTKHALRVLAVVGEIVKNVGLLIYVILVYKNINKKALSKVTCFLC